MSESTTSRVVILDDYLSLDGVEIIDLNPTLALFPPAGREDDVYRALAGAHPRLKVFRKAETPPHWHYRDHPRIPPIVGVVDEGWQILRRSTFNNLIAKGEHGPFGVHGYDPLEAPSMRGIFVASGPGLQSRSDRSRVRERAHLRRAGRSAGRHTCCERRRPCESPARSCAEPVSKQKRPSREGRP